MFNNKSKSDFSVETNGNSTSFIGTGSTFKGDITSNADMRIDGTLIGNIISSAKIIIGPNGYVEGDVKGLQADIVGKVSGNVTVKELLQLKGSSVVNGNLYAGKLQIEPTAVFNGQCTMTATEAIKEEKTEKLVLKTALAQ